MPRISRRAGVALVCAGALACSVVGMLLGVLAAGSPHPHLAQSRSGAVGPPATANPPLSVVTVVSTAAPPPATHPKVKHHADPGNRDKSHRHRHRHPGQGGDQGDG